MSRHKHKDRVAPTAMALPPFGIDTHAHLGDEAFDADRDEVIERALACGLARIANVCLDPERFSEEAALFAGHPEVFFLLGVHPDDAGSFSEETLALIRRHAASHASIRAIGEIGLDYSRPVPECTPHDKQKEAFRLQLGLARELGMPVAVHCRDAAEDTLALLEDEDFAGWPLVWHCFGQDKELVQRIVANDWYVSVPGTITFKNSHLAREAIPFIPDNRILMETDCPYLAPVPWRGCRNEPAYTVFSIRVMAECRGTTPEALWKLCGRNAQAFYRLG